jgi:hypothetical protein
LRAIGKMRASDQHGPRPSYRIPSINMDYSYFYFYVYVYDVAYFCSISIGFTPCFHFYQPMGPYILLKQADSIPVLNKSRNPNALGTLKNRLIVRCPAVKNLQLHTSLTLFCRPRCHCGCRHFGRFCGRSCNCTCFP